MLDHAGGTDDDVAPISQAWVTWASRSVIGMNERADHASGSLYNSLLTIGTDEHTLNLHRKLSPTHTERIV